MCRKVTLALLGDKGSGKSSLIRRCIKTPDAEDELLSSGLDYQTCRYRSSVNTPVDLELKIWELPAQNFSVAKGFTAQADALLLVLNADQPEASWEFLRDRVGQLNFGAQQGKQQCVMLAYNKFDLVGDKSDDEGEVEDELQEPPLPDKMQLKLNESAPTLILPLRPVSALTGSGVDDLFQEIVHAVLLQRQSLDEVEQVGSSSSETTETTVAEVEATSVNIKRRSSLLKQANRFRQSFRRKFSVGHVRG